MAEEPMKRRVLLACDGSPHSKHMVDVAFSHVVWPHADEIHLVSVYVPPAAATTVSVMPPFALPVTVGVIYNGAEALKKEEIAKARMTLQLMADHIRVNHKVPPESIQTHVLPSRGGASGVSDALLHFAKKHYMQLICVGNRGMHAFKRSLMSLIGLGSVSDAVIRSAPCPVLLVKWNAEQGKAHAGEEQLPLTTPVFKKVLVAYDGSPLSEAALIWALDNVLRDNDQLFIVTVSLVAPLPVSTALQRAELAVREAKAAVDKAVEIAASHGIGGTRVVAEVLEPDGGANEIGGTLCYFAKEKFIDVVVVGCRGLGAHKRGLLSFMGLGCVAEYLAHHLHCALAVVHQCDVRASEPAGPHETASTAT